MDAKPFVYDGWYVMTYDSPEYLKGNDVLQALRFGFVTGAIGGMPHSLVDFGYGNGAFLRFCQPLTKNIAGYDISGIHIPGIYTTSKELPIAEVYTFWDALEHVPDLSFLRDLPCKYIALSLPYCHFPDFTWFENWKHHKPDEHLHYFNQSSICSLMYHYGWKMIAHSHHEDLVRQSSNCLPNILTAAFVRLSTQDHDQFY